MPYVQVDIDLDELSDHELIDELEDRGYIILGETDDPIFKLRQSFLLDSPEQFRKYAAEFFRLNGMPV
jgi:hypothetical protein